MSFTAKDFRQSDVDIIDQYGKEYLAAPLPDDIQLGRPGDCFDWSAFQAAKHKGKYQYVEGIASEPGHPNVWVSHAWLSDGIHAFDPTWQAFRMHHGRKKYYAVPSRYVGVEIPIGFVRDFVRRTGYKAVIFNRWRAPELVQEMLDRKKPIILRREG
jgi:hypothetical protein